MRPVGSVRAVRAVRPVVALGLSVLLLAATVAGVGAGDTWCDIDPAVPIKTPAGNTVVVHVWQNGPGEHIGALAAASRVASTTSTADGKTEVTLRIRAENRHGHSHWMVSQVWTEPQGRGQMYSLKDGWMNDELVHVFTVDVP